MTSVPGVVPSPCAGSEAARVRTGQWRSSSRRLIFRPRFSRHRSPFSPRSDSSRCQVLLSISCVPFDLLPGAGSRSLQEGTTDRCGRSHPLQCTTLREDRQIGRMAVRDHSVTSPTVAQPIESVTHHSVYARTIRRRLQQSGLSARRPLLGLPLTQNHRRLRRQWCDERRMWAAKWNEVVFTDESRICLQHHDGRIRVWRHRGARMLNSCVMHHHPGPSPGIMVWGGIRYHSRTPLVRIAGTLNSQRYISEVLEPVVLPYLQGLATAIFQQDNARPHVTRIVQRFFVNHQIGLLPWLARSPDLSPIENM
ncbi:transposable element Tcb1 transposase [Trichonephila clavipes]|nr:transposable element Tcb1 transposase [Trichonephila clavipes]